MNQPRVARKRRNQQQKQRALTTPGGHFERADDLTAAAYLALVALLGNGDAERDMFDVISPDIIEAIREQVGSLIDNGGEVAARAVANYGPILNQRVKDINATTQNALSESLLEGIEAGESTDELVARVDKIFDAAIDTRARIIARTEVLTATNFAAMAALRELGATSKRWVGILDDRIRDSHEAAHGQIVGIDEKFQVGDSEMEYPGDPTAPAKEVCNCRCHVQPVMDGEERSAEAYMQYVVRSEGFEESLVQALRREFDKQRTTILSNI
jgi:SPP1 gp7 family putative phage head morphogenesis protein